MSSVRKPRTKHVLLDPEGALLSFVAASTEPDPRVRQRYFETWVDAQGPQATPQYVATARKVFESAASSIPDILKILGALGWLPHMAETTLRSALPSLLESRLLRKRDASSPDLQLELTELGRELLENDSYAEYLGSLPAVAHFWRPPNVLIYSEHNYKGNGSGFFVSPVHVVTARHVIEDLKSDIVISDTARRTYCVMQVDPHPDPSVDLACVTVDRKFPGRPMQLGSDAKPLDEVIVFGFPPVPQIQNVLLVTRGEVAAVTTDKYGVGTPVLLLTCLIRPGNSGGAVLRRDGTVIGVISRNLQHGLGIDDGDETGVKEALSQLDFNKALGIAAAVPAELAYAIPCMQCIGV